MEKTKGRMLSVSEVAASLGESERNVRFWAKQKVFPGAHLVDTPRGPYWEIPVEDLSSFKRPARGRPPQKKVR
jgi:hypothetical protein